MFILDAHQNIAYNAQQLGRNYLLPVMEQRRRAYVPNVPLPVNGLPDALLGRVGIVFASLLAIPEASPTKQIWDQHTYKNTSEAYAVAMWQMDYYKRLADESEKIRLIQTQSDLNEVLESWNDDKSVGDHLQGIVVLMEGADPITEPNQYEEWHEHGVRIVAPAWQQTRYSAGAGFSGDLTTLGYELLETLANYKAMLDLSHMSENAFKQAVERYEGSMIASHANPRYFCDSERCLSNDMIVRLAERDGVMGIMLYNRYLTKSWHHSDLKSKVHLSQVAEVIDYVCQLTGSADFVGIGSDLDFAYPYRSLPAEIDSITELWMLKDCLLGRGFGEAEISAILSGNMLRKLRQVLPE